MAILTSVFPPGERGRAMGINVTAVYAGLASGPFLGGLLTRYLGWRSIFAFLVPMGIISLILIRTKMKERMGRSQRGKLRLAGCCDIRTVNGGTHVRVFETAVGCRMDHHSRRTASHAAVHHEGEENRAPAFDITLISRNRVFAFSSLAALIHYAATSAIGFFLSLFLQYIKDLGPRDAGFVLMSWPLTMALISPAAGKLSDKP